MDKHSKIYIAGHRGLVGSAIVRYLLSEGYENLILSSHIELDLINQTSVKNFFQKERPEYVFLAAAKVGGIHACNTYKAQFIYENLQIQNNIIHYAYIYGVKKLLFLGSSCVYPKDSLQPIKEEYLLTNSLEPTNEPYSIAKISGLKMCEFYNEQYGCDFISAMPSNLYGINDNFDLENSHVLPSMIRKFYLAKNLYEDNFNLIRKDLIKRPITNVNANDLTNSEIENLLNLYGIEKENKTIVIFWGSGNVYREFLHVDDLAEALIFLMYNYYESKPINVGVGKDITINNLAQLIKEIVGFKGEILWDKSKPDGTPRKLLDITKLTQIGWQPKTKLADGIRRTFQFYKENNSTLSC
ncbi:MAG: GDP-L-fucose synthase [Proteobacteria bacterium]|nr:GDP-L-fucose synthase [Pseudomonadota bacterium]